MSLLWQVVIDYICVLNHSLPLLYTVLREALLAVSIWRGGEDWECNKFCHPEKKKKNFLSYARLLSDFLWPIQSELLMHWRGLLQSPVSCLLPWEWPRWERLLHLGFQNKIAYKSQWSKIKLIHRLEDKSMFLQYELPLLSNLFTSLLTLLLYTEIRFPWRQITFLSCSLLAPQLLELCLAQSMLSKSICWMKIIISGRN